jgi:uncharacterized membrane protein
LGRHHHRCLYHNSHLVLLLVTVLVFFFLVIEARRYRHYDIWQNRLRLLETDYFAPMLMGYAPGQTWRDLMARDLQHPRFRISMLEAMGWRLRRNYMWIFLTLFLSWIFKIIIHPSPLQSIGDFVNRVAVPPVPGWVMLLVGLIFNAYLFWIGLSTQGLRGASGEIMSREEIMDQVASDMAPAPSQRPT